MDVSKQSNSSPTVFSNYVSTETSISKEETEHTICSPETTDSILQFMRDNEISTKYLKLIEERSKYGSVLVLDDSSSMNELADKNGSYTLTRWDELRQMTKIIIEAHISMKQSCDIYFINRGHKRHVSSWEMIASYFISPPTGHTHLVGVLESIFQHQEEDPSLSKQPVIVHILTDGHPTNPQNQEDTNTFIACVLQQQQKHPQFYHFSIILCINDILLKSIYQNMKTIENIDVIEVYRSELQIIRRIHGKHYPFTIGDYIMKILTSTIDRSLHNVDNDQIGCQCSLS